MFLSLGHSIFEFASNFDIRISSFETAAASIMPSGLRPKPGPLDPDSYILHLQLLYTMRIALQHRSVPFAMMMGAERLPVETDHVSEKVLASRFRT